jgi:hypothetical protein
MAILFRHAEHVGHLLLQRIEALIKNRNRGLRSSGLIQETRGVCRAPLWEYLTLELVHLPLQPLEPLFRRRWLALGKGRCRNERNGR